MNKIITILFILFCVAASGQGFFNSHVSEKIILSDTIAGLDTIRSSGYLNYKYTDTIYMNGQPPYTEYGIFYTYSIDSLNSMTMNQGETSISGYPGRINYTIQNVDPTKNYLFIRGYVTNEIDTAYSGLNYIGICKRPSGLTLSGLAYFLYINGTPQSEFYGSFDDAQDACDLYNNPGGDTVEAGYALCEFESQTVTAGDKVYEDWSRNTTDCDYLPDGFYLDVTITKIVEIEDGEIKSVTNCE